MIMREFLGGLASRRNFTVLLVGILTATGLREARAFNELELSGGEFCLRRAAPPATPESSDYRQYAPDRKVDVLHLALDVTPDFKQRTVSGQATLSFKPIAKPLEELRLDGVDLTVTKVTASEKIRAWQVTDSEVI